MALLVAALLAAVGCARVERAVPGCEAGERLALVAQSVPDAAYVPCVDELAAGWSATDWEVESGRTSFTLRSDRAAAPVEVELVSRCDPSGATPLAPRDAGVRTQQRLDSISPAYRGTVFDLFPGGCVTYGFDFERGPHIALMDDLLRSVRLFPRRVLRQELADQVGVDIGT